MKIPVVEHPIQRDILRRLAVAESLRFSQLKPKNLEANVFMYHVHQLIKNGCIEKEAGVYRLGLNGLRYAHSVNNGNFMPDREPKVIAVIVLQNDNGELLLVHRHKQPYINDYMFISGRQYFGESPEEHAERELAEKTGLRDIALRHRGMINNRVHTTGDEVVTHVVGYVYSGLYNGPVPPDTEYWSFSWQTPEQLQNGSLSLLPGTAELYASLQAHPIDLFFSSADFSIV